MSMVVRPSSQIDPAPLRTPLAAKLAVVLVALLMVRALAAQAPAPSRFIVPVGADPEGYKVHLSAASMTTGTPSPQLPASVAMSRAKALEASLRTQIRQMLGNTSPLDRQRLEQYYVLYYFPMMTQTTPEALQEAATVIAALPQQLRRLVDHVEVLTVDQITLVLRDGRTVVWGSSDDSQQKAVVLLALLEQPAKIYDVSVPSQPTTRN